MVHPVCSLSFAHCQRLGALYTSRPGSSAGRKAISETGRPLGKSKSSCPPSFLSLFFRPPTSYCAGTADSGARLATEQEAPGTYSETGRVPSPGGTSPVPSPRAVNDPSSAVSTPTFVIDGSFRKGLAISKSSNSKNTSTHHPADIRALDRKVIPRQEGVCDGSFDATTPPHRCHGTSSGEAAPSSRPEESGNSEKDRRKLILVHCQCSKRKRHPSTAPLLRLLPSFVLLGACGRHLVPAGKGDLRGRGICA